MEPGEAKKRQAQSGPRIQTGFREYRARVAQACDGPRQEAPNQPLETVRAGAGRSFDPGTVAKPRNRHICTAVPTGLPRMQPLLFLVPFSTSGASNFQRLDAIPVIARWTSSALPALSTY